MADSKGLPGGKSLAEERDSFGLAAVDDFDVDVDIDVDVAAVDDDVDVDVAAVVKGGIHAPAVAVIVAYNENFLVTLAQ